MAIVDKIIAYLRDKGPEFGPEMCEALGLHAGSLSVYVKGALADGRLTCEKLPYKGTQRLVNRFDCGPASQRPAAAPAAPHRFDPNDPFGLVAKAGAAKQITPEPAQPKPPIEIPVYLPAKQPDAPTPVAVAPVPAPVAAPEPSRAEIEIGIFSSGRLSISNKAGEMTLSKREVHALLAFVRSLPDQFFSPEPA